MRVGLLADHCVILVVAVVCISESNQDFWMFQKFEMPSNLPEFAIRPELKLKKLVPKLPLVADIVAQVEVVGHVDASLQILFQMIM